MRPVAPVASPPVSLLPCWTNWMNCAWAAGRSAATRNTIGSLRLVVMRVPFDAHRMWTEARTEYHEVRLARSIKKARTLHQGLKLTLIRLNLKYIGISSREADRRNRLPTR